jgi:hypothetical protein
LDLGVSHGIYDATAVRSGQSARIDRIGGTVAASPVTLDPLLGLTPFVGVTFNAASINQCTEPGSASGTPALTETLSLDLSSSVEHNIPRKTTAIAARFANAGTAGTPFTVEADTFGSTAFRAGGGLRLNLGKAGALGAGYEFSGGNNLKASSEFRANYAIPF